MAPKPLASEECPTMRRRTGFTLVELLVVVAILGMLVGMLVPILTRAKELGRRAVCAKNLQSAAHAMRTYATEFQAYPALYLGRPGTWLIGAQVTQSNYQYKGNSCNMYAVVALGHISSAAFICPSTTHTRHADENQTTDDDFRSRHNLSYSMHVQREEQSTNKEWRPLTLNSEANMALMADRTPISGNTSWSVHAGSGGSEATPTKQTSEGGTSKAKQNSFNHDQEGQNVAYVDCHVNWQTSPKAGLDTDNIWTWDDNTEDGSTIGRYSEAFRDTCAAHRRDSFLFP